MVVSGVLKVKLHDERLAVGSYVQVCSRQAAIERSTKVPS